MAEERGVLHSIHIPKRLFRPFLARIGHHYLDDQLNEGFSVFGVRHEGKEYTMRVFLGNHGLTGFFIRIGIQLKSQPCGVIHSESLRSST